jgi:hypothetical protein
MSDPRPALEALLVELTRRGSPLGRYLRRGLQEDEVVSKMSVNGALPHADVVALYAWHDGFDRFDVPVSPEGFVSLFPAHPEFNPLDETLQVFQQRRELAEAEATVPVRHADGSWNKTDAEQIWSRSWFPVFEGGGSELIFISNSESQAGSVWLHPVQDEPRRLYDSLGAAADAVRLALVDGRLVLDDSGVFTVESRSRDDIQL